MEMKQELAAYLKTLTKWVLIKRTCKQIFLQINALVWMPKKNKEKKRLNPLSFLFFLK